MLEALTDNVSNQRILKHLCQLSAKMMVMVGADESLLVPLCMSLLGPLLAPRPVIRGRHTSDTKRVGSSIPKQVVSCCPCRLWSGVANRGTWRPTACTGATGMGLRAPAGVHVQFINMRTPLLPVVSWPVVARRA